MKILRLKRLILRNFKGVAFYEFVPDGKSAEIRGDNATGKTTLHDAWTWLLFGRDSAGRTDFSIKTLVNGEPAHNLDHSVEADLDIDGEPVRLARVYREKWVKKRGAASSELTGHTTEYGIDGVPLQEKEWKARIADLAPEDTWRLVTGPGAFAAMHWQDRRKILLSLCEGASDADVIASSPELADLPTILGKRSQEDHRRVITARRKEANARLTEIPARIDELSRTLAAIDGMDRGKLSARLSEVEGLIEDAKAGAGDEVLRRERSATETRRQELVGQRRTERSASLRTLRDRLSDARSEILAAQRKAGSAERMAEQQDNETEGNEHRAATLRADFSKASSPAPDPPGTCTCAACGDTHAVPAERIEDAKRRSNLARAEQLQTINEQGKAAVAAGKQCRQAARKYRDEAAKYRNAEAEATATVKRLTDETAAAETAPHALDEQIAELAQKVADLDAKIAEVKAGATDTTALDSEKKQLGTDIAKLDAAEGTKSRIAELAAEQKKLSAEIERLEKELNLLDRFVVAQAEMTEARVNSLFEIARFRLFRPQVNGGIEQCCDVLVDGVPYGGGLNHGSEINAGLDIVRTLSRHFGLSAPVFIDNSEAVVRPLDCGSQTIRLIVDGSAKKMEVTLE